MQLKQIKGTSKKTGKEFVGYYVAIGEYRTPLFFPSKIEVMYIKNYLRDESHKDFKGDDFDVEEEAN